MFKQTGGFGSRCVGASSICKFWKAGLVVTWPRQSSQLMPVLAPGALQRAAVVSVCFEELLRQVTRAGCA